MLKGKQREGKSVFISSEIEKVIRNIKKNRDAKYSFWKEAVGEKIAGVARPVSFKNFVLVVNVKDSVWRFELSRRKKEILEKLNSVISSDQKVKDIVFR